MVNTREFAFNMGKKVMQIAIPNIKPVYCMIICHSGRMNISTHRNHVYVVFSIVTADSIATSVMGQAYVINKMNYFLRSSSDNSLCVTIAFFCQHRGMFQNSIRCLIIRTHKVLKPRDLCLELSNRSQIWQAYRQYCCRSTCHVS